MAYDIATFEYNKGIYRIVDEGAHFTLYDPDGDDRFSIDKVNIRDVGGDPAVLRQLFFGVLRVQDVAWEMGQSAGRYAHADELRKLLDEGK